VRVLACLQVPRGTWQLDPIVDAITAHHPDWQVGAVWCGDPHLRPAAHERAPWIDLALPCVSEAGWGRLLVGLPERSYDWARTAMALLRSFDAQVDAAVVLRVGSAAVVGDLTALVPDHGIALASRTGGLPLPVDGRAPGERHLVAMGDSSSAVVGCRRDSGAALLWLADALVDATDDAAIGHWLGRAGAVASAPAIADGAVHALGWQAWDPAHTPSVLDLDALDRSEPWHVGFDGAPSRLRMSAHPDLAELVQGALCQVDGAPAALTLPGDVDVDRPIRTLVADALAAWRRGEGELPPAPYGADHSAFLRWLETPSPVWGADIGRYWRVLREQRADLQAAFPRSDSDDQSRFVEWARTSWQLERRSVLIRPSIGSSRTPVQSVGHNHNGINVVGYLAFDSSLGDVGRRIVASLDAAHVPVAALEHHRTGSPRSPQPPVTTVAAHHHTNLVVVNADQFHFFVADHGDTLLRGRRTIAYWFWELEHVPAHMRDAIAHVDEIWAGTRFVADAFAAVTDTPVRCVPIPVTEPRPSGATRAELGMPEGRFTFVVTFDHFSVAERKNPWGAVEAYRRAFPEPTPDGPVLVVKTINGDRRWQNHERLLLAAAGRPDIVVLDAHLDRADQMAVLANADCLVSLHRSEGLGLHCAEAMWLGKPVVATRYSGNLDFMDDDCSVLIDATLVPVSHGEGVYPTSAVWADPDLDQAATWLRRLATEPDLVARLGAAARRKMAAQPSPAATGRTIAREAGLGPYEPTPPHRSPARVDLDATLQEGTPP
jgi:glycosyltransferase involved in cell wall biosynthesis